MSLIGTGLMFGQSSQQAPGSKQAVSGPADTKTSTSAEAAANQIIDKIVAKEAALGATMKEMHPLVETYLQTLEKDDELAFHPTGDQYFLGKQSAPELQMAKVDQIAALPLGGRVRVDPWSGKIELVKSKPVALFSALEKMPFEVTPVYLYLTRQTAAPRLHPRNPQILRA